MLTYVEQLELKRRLNAGDGDCLTVDADTSNEMTYFSADLVGEFIRMKDRQIWALENRIGELELRLHEALDCDDDK